MIKYGGPKKMDAEDKTFEALIVNEVIMPRNNRYSNYDDYLSDTISSTANLQNDDIIDYENSKSCKLWDWVNKLGINEDNQDNLKFGIDSRTGECLYVTFEYQRLRLNYPQVFE